MRTLQLPLTDGFSFKASFKRFSLVFFSLRASRPKQTGKEVWIRNGGAEDRACNPFPNVSVAFYWKSRCEPLLCVGALSQHRDSCRLSSSSCFLILCRLNNEKYTIAQLADHWVSRAKVVGSHTNYILGMHSCFEWQGQTWYFPKPCQCNGLMIHLLISLQSKDVCIRCMKDDVKMQTADVVQVDDDGELCVSVVLCVITAAPVSRGRGGGREAAAGGGVGLGLCCGRAAARMCVCVNSVVSQRS